MNKIDFKTIGFLRNPSEDCGVTYAYVYGKVPAITLTKESKKDQKFTTVNGQRQFVEFTKYDIEIEFRTAGNQFYSLNKSVRIRETTENQSLEDIYNKIVTATADMLQYAASDMVVASLDENRVVTKDNITEEEKAWGADYEFNYRADRTGKEELFIAFYNQFNKVLTYDARRFIENVAADRVRNGKTFADFDSYDQRYVIEALFKGLSPTVNLEGNWGSIEDKKFYVKKSDPSDCSYVERLPDNLKTAVLATVKSAVDQITAIQNQAMRTIRSTLDIKNDIVA